MADEQEAGNSRPVDPPIIDVEAEEVGRSQEIPPELAEEVSKVVPESRRFGTVWLATALAGLALLIACASLAVIVGRANLASTGDAASFDAKLAPLATASDQMQARIGELTVAIDLLREQSQASRPVQPDLSAVTEQLQRLESTLGSLNERLEAFGGSLEAIEKGQGAQQTEFRNAMSEIGKLQAMLGSDKGQSVPQQPAERNEVAADFLKLKTAIDEGRPFGSELERVRTAVPGAQGLQELAAVSTGGPKVGDLAERLRKSVAELKVPAAPETAATEPQGIWNTFKSKAASLVNVRKLEDARWLDGAENALVRMDERDLAGAVRILRSVEGTPPAALQSWLEEAEKRLEVDRALENLSASVLKTLGGGS